MKKFSCHCGNTLYFENTVCFGCGRTLGFLPGQLVLGAFDEAEGGWSRSLVPGAPGRFKKCSNYADEGVCNWMVPEGDAQQRCFSCRLNLVIPNLDKPENRRLWFKVEQAKRRLLYTLLSLGLPVVGRDSDPEAGLAFNFKEDVTGAMGGKVFTGHYRGSITINVREADPSAREEIRRKMNEKYRTVLGHFRHEIGHYYWDRLVDGSHWIDAFREVFGDERADYQEALKRYYAEGPAPGWERDYISAYGTSHPWEDFSETFAHYLHMMDTMETAHDYGFAIHGEAITHPSKHLKNKTFASGTQCPTFDEILEDMVSLTLVMNALNRSMGMSDPYPFALTPPVVRKLRLVHGIVCETANKE